MDKITEYTISHVNGEIYKCNEAFPNLYCLKLCWDSPELGFGEVRFFYNEKTEVWSVDDECMSENFCKKVLSKWLETIYKK